MNSVAVRQEFCSVRTDLIEHNYFSRWEIILCVRDRGETARGDRLPAHRLRVYCFLCPGNNLVHSAAPMEVIIYIVIFISSDSSYRRLLRIKIYRLSWTRYCTVLKNVTNKNLILINLRRAWIYTTTHARTHTIMADFKVLSRHSPVETKQKYEKLDATITGKSAENQTRYFRIQAQISGLTDLNIWTRDYQPSKTWSRIHHFSSTRGPRGYKWGQLIETSWQSTKSAT
jgi:hypothetical protein